MPSLWQLSRMGSRAIKLCAQTLKVPRSLQYLKRSTDPAAMQLLVVDVGGGHYDEDAASQDTVYHLLDGLTERSRSYTTPSIPDFSLNSVVIPLPIRAATDEDASYSACIVDLLAQRESQHKRDLSMIDEPMVYACTMFSFLRPSSQCARQSGGHAGKRRATGASPAPCSQQARPVNCTLLLPQRRLCVRQAAGGHNRIHGVQTSHICGRYDCHGGSSQACRLRAPVRSKRQHCVAGFRGVDYAVGSGHFSYAVVDRPLATPSERLHLL